CHKMVLGSGLPPWLCLDVLLIRECNEGQ
ncbi:hypothetical protein A2U01_0062136, partial [Trifolium medium]|nr:hypothetical protein [Trifolium medium]